MKMTQSCSILLLLFVFTFVNGLGLEAFTGRVRISKDPAVRGSLNANITYVHTDGKIYVKFNYDLGPTTIIRDGTEYFTCRTSCRTNTWKSAQLAFSIPTNETYSTGSSFTHVDGRVCTNYTRSISLASQTDIITLSFDSSNFICTAFRVDGKTFSFRNITSLSSPSVEDLFGISTSLNCPAPTCFFIADIFLVFDESSSIPDTDWQIFSQFGQKLANSFTIGAGAVQMGVIYYGGSARTAIGLSQDKISVINTLLNAKKGGGNTCIACGLKRAYQAFPYSRAGFNSVQSVIIMMTDGISNARTEEIPGIVSDLRSAGAITFTIGVGNETNEQQLRTIASNIPKIQTYYYSPSFTVLEQAVLGALTNAVCLDLPTTSCGDSCRGFCSCDLICVCPDDCFDSEPCTRDVCGNPNFGCSWDPVVCNDNNKCTTDRCVNGVGCRFTNISVETVCSNGDKCSLAQCTPSIGCQNPPNLCRDDLKCTNDTCVAGVGCSNPIIPGCLCENVNCTPPDKCTESICDPYTGICVQSAKVCDDGSECSTDTCNPLTGCVFTSINCSDNNACTADLCSPTLGCYFQNYTISSYCDDLNLCTEDTCDPINGCVHTTITCEEDDDACTVAKCTSLQGCQFYPKDCGTYFGDLGACYIARCDSNDTDGVGCIKELAEGAYFDECGECRGKGLSCFNAKTAGIGAGAIAAIIVGVAVGVGAAFGGSVKGVKYYQKMRTNPGVVHENKIFEEPKTGGENVLYTEMT